MTRRFGAVAAIVGAVISIAAGAAGGEVEGLGGNRAMLVELSTRPDWHWTAIHLGVVLGAVLWVIAFVVLADSLAGRSHALAGVAAATRILGASIHLIHSAASVGAWTGLVEDWRAMVANEQTLTDAAILSQALEVLWAAVVAFFHGVPFVLFGLALVLSARHPSWLGWTGVLGGAGSLLVGLIMFVGRDTLAAYVPFAVIDSLWMIAIGVGLWRGAPSMLHVREGSEPETAREAA